MSSTDTNFSNIFHLQLADSTDMEAVSTKGWPQKPWGWNPCQKAEQEQDKCLTLTDLFWALDEASPEDSQPLSTSLAWVSHQIQPAEVFYVTWNQPCSNWCTLSWRHGEKYIRKNTSEVYKELFTPRECYAIGSTRWLSSKYFSCLKAWSFLQRNDLCVWGVFEPEVS
jgi:hypothetical protein